MRCENALKEAVFFQEYLHNLVMLDPTRPYKIRKLIILGNECKLLQTENDDLVPPDDLVLPKPGPIST